MTKIHRFLLKQWPETYDPEARIKYRKELEEQGYIITKESGFEGYSGESYCEFECQRPQNGPRILFKGGK